MTEINHVETVPASEYPTVQIAVTPAPTPPAPPRGRRPWYRQWKVLVPAAVVVVAAVVALVLVLASGGPSAAYTVDTIATGTVSQTVSASGTLQPVNSSDVNFAVSGQVTNVAVAVGSKVAQGQTLATVDSTSLGLAVQQAQATLSSAQATLSEDQSSGTATSAQLTADTAAVTSAQSSLTAAQSNLAAATLTAPIAGTVTTVNLSNGQTVSGSSSSASASSSDSQFVIQDLSSFEVSASVSTSSIDDVKVGDQAVITPSSSVTPVYGTVTSKSSVPTVSSGVATFPVVITVTGDSSGLYAGTSASVSIITAEKTDVLTAPNDAISISTQGRTVNLLHGTQQVPTRITVGLVGSSESQVTSGLKAGDRVAIPVTPTAGSTSSGSSGFGRSGFPGLGGSGFSGLGGGSFRQVSPGGGFFGGSGAP